MGAEIGRSGQPCSPHNVPSDHSRCASQKAGRFPLDTAQLIKRVENMFRCIRFNPITQAFEAYEGRINGILDYCSSINDFACYADSWDEPVNGYGEFGCELIKRWFPHSEICIINKRPPQGEVKDTILSYLKQHDYMNRALSKEEQSNIIDNSK